MHTHSTARLLNQHDISQMISALPVPAFAFDMATAKFCAVNMHFANLLTYSEAELLNMTVDAIQPPERLAACHEARKNAPPAGFVHWDYVRKDGGCVRVKSHYRELQYLNGTGEKIDARLVIVEFWESVAA